MVDGKRSYFKRQPSRKVLIARVRMMVNLPHAEKDLSVDEFRRLVLFLEHQETIIGSLRKCQSNLQPRD